MSHWVLGNWLKGKQGAVANYEIFLGFEGEQETPVYHRVETMLFRKTCLKSIFGESSK